MSVENAIVLSRRIRVFSFRSFLVALSLLLGRGFVFTMLRLKLESDLLVWLWSSCNSVAKRRE